MFRPFTFGWGTCGPRHLPPLDDRHTIDSGRSTARTSGRCGRKHTALSEHPQDAAPRAPGGGNRIAALPTTPHSRQLRFPMATSHNLSANACVVSAWPGRRFDRRRRAPEVIEEPVKHEEHQGERTHMRAKGNSRGHRRTFARVAPGRAHPRPGQHRRKMRPDRPHGASEHDRFSAGKRLFPRFRHRSDRSSAGSASVESRTANGTRRDTTNRGHTRLGQPRRQVPSKTGERLRRPPHARQRPVLDIAFMDLRQQPAPHHTPVAQDAALAHARALEPRASPGKPSPTAARQAHGTPPCSGESTVLQSAAP